ncbi:MAG: hypothetical protein ISP41_19165, partial [Alphaproteobacteria bacterium]|nr:hypothetical protein [Alphaproteobacteria bacterium]
MTKPTLALLPGLLCDAALWSHQTAALGKTVDIVAPDLATHDTIAELARLVLAELPERFSLAGFPWADTWRWRSCVKRRRGWSVWPCSAHRRAPIPN